ncbi:transposase [Candidatus Tisiphia endosymbiont of Beris chalybata]
MPVEWLLFTTLDIDKDSTVLEIVKYYQLRWQIEIYFKILKSGCKIEELQLENIARLKNAISIDLLHNLI